MLKQAELWQHIPITRNPPCIRKLSALFFFFILYVWLARAGYSSSISSSGTGHWAPRASRSSFRRRLPPHRRPGPPLVLPVPCRTPWWRRRRGIHIHQPGLELYGCSRRRLRQRKPMEPLSSSPWLPPWLCFSLGLRPPPSRSPPQSLLSPGCPRLPSRFWLGTASLVAAAASSTLAPEALLRGPSSSLLEPARPPPRASPGGAPARARQDLHFQKRRLRVRVQCLPLLHPSFWLLSRWARTGAAAAWRPRRSHRRPSPNTQGAPHHSRQVAAKLRAPGAGSPRVGSPRPRLPTHPSPPLSPSSPQEASKLRFLCVLLWVSSLLLALL